MMEYLSRIEIETRRGCENIYFRSNLHVTEVTKAYETARDLIGVVLFNERVVNLPKNSLVLEGVNGDVLEAIGRISLWGHSELEEYKIEKVFEDILIEVAAYNKLTPLTVGELNSGEFTPISLNGVDYEVEDFESNIFPLEVYAYIFCEMVKRGIKNINPTVEFKYELVEFKLPPSVNSTSGNLGFIRADYY